jgi:phosphate/phosphite/phosphonate ABC transporter binding protein
MSRAWRIATFAAAALTAALPAVALGETVRIGFYASRDREEVTRAAKAFCSYCEQTMSVSVVPLVAETYTEGVGALADGSVDLAWLSPISVVQAEQNGKAHVLLKSMRREEPYYWGAVVVRAESGIASIGDLKGKRFGWTDPTSTAGHLLTRAALIRAGMRPERDFGSNQFLGGHDRLVKAVLKGTVDAGATFANDPEKGFGAWTIYLAADEASKLRAIFYTEPIPGDAVVGSTAFLTDRRAVADSMIACLTRMGDDPKGKSLLQSLYNVDRLIPAESKDYDSVRLAVEALRQAP